ncbi:hypothetical protein [Microbacterium sp. Bi128]|uniref:hypothetical protein n=1 Tax=Microbacterium sp. Bi128 TaxID=2821115 RepID=UPI001DC872FC|nr:hypothetical protein [Microbacterium sp. Bi128]CAH0165411.1 hypothetical protein SRABI128_00898 [Microbacterium sp. Bi128]
MDMPQPGLGLFSNENGLVVRRGPMDVVPYAVFEGTPPTPRQVSEVVSRGYGLHFVGAHSDLRFLTGSGLSHLSVSGYDLDTRVVSELRSLVSLHFLVAETPETNLSGLDALRRYFGFLRDFESALRAPNLEVAEFHEVHEGSLPGIPRQIRELTLHGARQVRELPLEEGIDAPELRELYLHGCRRFDVTSLTAFPRLEMLTLESISNVVEIGSLADLPTLRQLSVLQCRSADGIASLAEVRGLEVLVVGKLAEAVRDLANRADPRWTLLKRL